MGEGYLYIKTPVTVKLKSGELVDAFAYVYNHDVSECERIIGRLP
ncbi:MAG: gamma-glutamylcyclotransferase [Lachnospiraceae bacterium]|nr:gamma-glutamylcyclotransferase [Lachnospiraceae bacterium]